jgi:hypothetical protein
MGEQQLQEAENAVTFTLANNQFAALQKALATILGDCLV